jgi:mitogen-activated protein kinase 15
MGVRPGEELTMTEFVATRWYRSPEIIFGSRRYSKETDLWSFGCILGEMLAGRAMFSGKTILEQIEKILAFVGCPSSEDMQSLNTEQASELFDPAKIKKIPSSYWFKDVSD